MGTLIKYVSRGGDPAHTVRIKGYVKSPQIGVGFCIKCHHHSGCRVSAGGGIHEEGIPTGIIPRGRGNKFRPRSHQTSSK